MPPLLRTTASQPCLSPHYCRPLLLPHRRTIASPLFLATGAHPCLCHCCRRPHLPLAAPPPAVAPPSSNERSPHSHDHYCFFLPYRSSHPLQTSPLLPAAFPPTVVVALLQHHYHPLVGPRCSPASSSSPSFPLAMQSRCCPLLELSMSPTLADAASCSHVVIDHHCPFLSTLCCYLLRFHSRFCRCHCFPFQPSLTPTSTHFLCSHTKYDVTDAIATVDALEARFKASKARIEDRLQEPFMNSATPNTMLLMQ
ncbi:hypothetical protein BHM03_00012441 [Ensete ventricosum]|nr:hypothetical protein BHM03_00012441 [Ensete ventricosum]